MRNRRLSLLIVAAALLAVFAGEAAIAPGPPQIKMDYGFSSLDPGTLEQLLHQGALVVVRTRDDESLINVTAGQLVKAPRQLVFSTITDFEHYPEFMPQTTEEKILERDGDRILVEQTIEVKIWRLPSVDTTYQLTQELSPPNKVRFWHVSGDLEGTYGGWDLVEADGQTMIFYTLYSNLTALGYGLGSVMKSQPDFMTGVNVTTAVMVTKAVKQECERRVGK